jgi:hypothetical protein
MESAGERMAFEKMICIISEALLGVEKNLAELWRRSIAEL